MKFTIEIKKRCYPKCFNIKLRFAWRVVHLVTSIKECIYFFCQQYKYNNVDSVNQTCSSVFIWTTNDDCFLAMRARMSLLNSAYVIYKWALSCWNLSSSLLCLLNNLQRLVILLILKPSSITENNIYLFLKPTNFTIYNVALF